MGGGVTGVPVTVGLGGTRTPGPPGAGWKVGVGCADGLSLVSGVGGVVGVCVGKGAGGGGSCSSPGPDCARSIAWCGSSEEQERSCKTCRNSACVPRGRGPSDTEPSAARTGTNMDSASSSPWKRATTRFTKPSIRICVRLALLEECQEVELTVIDAGKNIRFGRISFGTILITFRCYF